MSVINLNESDLRILIESVIESEIYTGKQIADHIINITPDSNDVPDYFITKFILPNKFRIKRINLNNLLKSDPSFKDYFESGEERYEQDEMSPDDLYNYMVIFNGEVLDGYSRGSYLLRNGYEEIDAFVNVTSNVAD